ncbi:MAG: hypothetical protein ACP5GH_01445 [Nitrososphaeria archaeon]
MIVEGKARILRKKEGLEAFYNPLGYFSRSVFVKIFTAYARIRGGELTYAEPFSGTGIKAIRLALEGEGFIRFLLNDLSRSAAELARLNWTQNSPKGEVQIFNLDVHDFLETLSRLGRVDAMDVDPFGSSAPYVFNSVRAIKGEGLVAFTFTDTQVLGGIHSEALYKRYHVVARKVSFLKEMQARIAAANVIMEASVLNLAAVPVFAHVDKHYIRTYHIIRPSAKLALELVSELNSLLISSCGYVTREELYRCPYCCDRMLPVGPIYTGRIYDKRIISVAKDLSEDCPECKKLFEMALEELDEIPYYYDLRALSSNLKTQTPATRDLVDVLKEMGFRASRTAFYTSGVKTEAPFGVLRSLFYQRSGR